MLEKSHPLMMPSIVLATFIYTLDSTIAAVALPHMQGTFSSTQEQVAWVLTSYIVMSAIMTPMAGFLADRFGRKQIFLIAIVGFTVSSMLCGLAMNLEEIVIFRLLQGAFGAAFVPLAQATVLDSFPPEKYGSAMAMFGVGVMLGPIIGPTLGSWLTEYYSWRWVFFINLPFGILAFIGIQMSVKGQTTVNRERPFDLWGFAYLGIAIGAFQLMLDRGNSLSWFQSTEIIIEAMVTVICFYLFLVQIFTAARPFVSPGLFRDRNFTGCTILGFAIGFNLMATMALLPPFLQNLLGYPVLDTGWLLAPRGVGTMLAMILVGRIVGRIDSRLLILIGILVSAWAMWEMSLFDINVTTGMIVWTGILQGVGMGLTFVPLSSLAFVTLEPQFRNEASGIYSLSRNVGSSVGVSVLMGSLGVYYRTNREALVPHISPFNENLRSLSDYTDPATTHGLAILDMIVSREALLIAYLDDFRAMMFIVLISTPLLLLLKPVPQSRSG